MVILTGYAVASAAAFVFMGIDKALAKSGARRVPEKTLHVIELVGGWPGSAAAMLFFRHKSSKPAFYVLTIGAALLHAAAWGGWFWIVR